jgi:hypothetical protein
MPALGEGEVGEHADGVERDQRGHDAAEDDDQDHRGEGQDADAARVDEAVADVVELARQEAVARHEGGQQGEAVEGGIRREHEDHHRDDLDEPERQAADPEDLAGDQGDDRAPAALVGRDVEPVGEHGQAAEHEGREHAQGGERRPGVIGRRRLEVRHAGGDGLDAGERGAARGEGLEHEEEAQALGGLEHLELDRAGRPKTASW